jgi:hypothetical protein
MSTAIAPPQPEMPDKPAKATLASLMKNAGKERDGGWGKIRSMVKGGRKVTREERLRWQENREFYRGNQTVFIANGEQQLRGNLSAHQVARSGSNSYNRLRQFVDGRVALLTKERPPYEVIPEDRDQDSIDAARQAEKFIAARWGHTGWNIKRRVAEIVKNADIDGISWFSVTWDRDAAESVDQLVAVDALTGEPISDRATYEALKAQDPSGETLWKMVRSKQPLGDVAWRVVLPGAISVDPFAIKDPNDAKWVCESRIRPREEVEQHLGMGYKDAVRHSSQMAGEKTMDVQYEDIAIDDGTSSTGKVSEADGLVVHHFYARPSHEFPRGVHLEFADKCPDKAWVIEAWEDEIPYFCFVPRPDPGHFIRSKGMTDDLKPIQRDYNSTLNDLREWLKRVARTPVAMPFGSMASDSYFNEEGVFFYHAAMGEPHHSNVPAEPTAVLTNELNRKVQEMRDISGISASAQGLRAPGGPEAAVGINLEIQQTENNLSEVEANLTEAIEWGVSRSLKLVERHYSSVRTVAGLGVDDAEELAAFEGAMLRGAHRMRITGPLMPKSKAARMAAIQAFIPMLGEKVIPFMAGLIDGDPTELARDIEVDRQNQKRETRELLSLAGDEKALIVYKNFEEDKQAFSEAFNIAVQSGAPDPMAVLGGQGILPPQLTPMLNAAGFDMPLVEDFHNHALELKALDEFRKSDGYKKVHPMGKQLLREHADSHKQGMSQQVMAMAEQTPSGTQGSAPKETGTPSAPKNAPPSPGGIQ